MSTKRLWILPLLVVATAILAKMDVLHLGYLHIKSHELKFTELDYDWFPQGKDIFTAGISITNNNYEDGIIAFNPDYKKLLQNDLREIASHREYIDSISADDLSFYSGPYRVQLCLDHKKVNFRDTTLFKKTVYLNVLGQFELYDIDSSELLYKQEGRKFLIQDSIVLKGWARKELIENKIEEIWLAQASNHAYDFVSRYEYPERYRQTAKDLMRLIIMSKVTSGDIDFNEETIRNQAYQILGEIRKIYYYRSTKSMNNKAIDTPKKS